MKQPSAVYQVACVFRVEKELQLVPGGLTKKQLRDRTSLRPCDINRSLEQLTRCEYVTRNRGVYKWTVA